MACPGGTAVRRTENCSVVAHGAPDLGIHERNPVQGPAHAVRLGSPGAAAVRGVDNGLKYPPQMIGPTSYGPTRVGIDESYRVKLARTASSRRPRGAGIGGLENDIPRREEISEPSDRDAGVGVHEENGI